MRPFKVMGGVTAPVAGSVDIFNTSCNDSGTGVTTAQYSLNSSGAGSGTNIAGWTWLLSGLNSDYEVFATLNSGDSPTGPIGSWVALSTTRTWALTAVISPEIKSCSLGLEIRPAGGGANLDTATITISAERT